MNKQNDDGLYGVMNTRGENVIEEISHEIEVSDSAIFITMEDNTIRQYDKNLNLTDDFYIINSANGVDNQVYDNWL